MKRAVILINALIIGFFAPAMDAPMRQASKKRSASEIEESGEIPPSKEERIEKSAPGKPVKIESGNSLFAGYPEEVGQEIRSYLYSGSGMGAEKLYNATRNIRMQRLVSKAERDKIDDPKFTDALIRDLAHRYAGGSLVKAAVALHTKAAADWLNNLLVIEDQNRLTFLKNQVTQELISLLRNGYTDSARFLFNASKVRQQQRYLLNFALKDPAKYTLLNATARAGDKYIFDRILPSMQAQINNETREGDTPLSDAIAREHAQIALALLQAGADPLLLDENGAVIDSVLPDAAELNMTEVVHALLANPDVRNSINITPENNPIPAIGYAITNNNYPMFKEILAVPGVAPTGQALFEAMGNNTQMVADLKKFGVPVNTGFTLGDIQTFPAFGVFGRKENGDPADDDATTRDRLALLLPELDVNVAEGGAISLLINAVEQAKSKTVELLLNAGAQVNWKDPRGRDALWYANQLTSYNKDHIIKLLKNALEKQKGGLS